MAITKVEKNDAQKTVGIRANQEPLTMAVNAGLFIIGTLVGGNKLMKPRIFQIIKSGTEIQMSPFPGTPGSVRIDPGGIYYQIPPTEPNKNIYDLYKRVTDPAVDPGTG